MLDGSEELKKTQGTRQSPVIDVQTYQTGSFLASDISRFKHSNNAVTLCVADLWPGVKSHLLFTSVRLNLINPVAFR